MNAVLDHIDNISNRLTRLFHHLRVEGNNDQIFNLDLLKLSILTLARHLTPWQSWASETETNPIMDAQADALLKDRELVYALAGTTQRPIFVSYLYLRAFSVWNEIAHNDEEVARFRHFA